MITFNNGVSIPQVGLGVFRTESGEDTVNAVKWAIEAGYRHIDTAKAYGNEKSVGDGIKACEVAREQSFGMRIQDKDEQKKHLKKVLKSYRQTISTFILFIGQQMDMIKHGKTWKKSIKQAK